MIFSTVSRTACEPLVRSTTALVLDASMSAIGYLTRTICSVVTYTVLPSGWVNFNQGIAVSIGITAKQLKGQGRVVQVGVVGSSSALPLVMSACKRLPSALFLKPRRHALERVVARRRIGAAMGPGRGI